MITQEEIVLGRKKDNQVLRSEFAKRFGILQSKVNFDEQCEMDELWKVYQLIDKK